MPEVWQAVAASTGVEGLNKTTRDIPDYDELMHYRLDILAREGISMSAIETEIDKLDPLAGAVDFLNAAREHFQIAIISDTFYEFARPLMRKLGHPMLLCHKLSVENDHITDYHIRQQDPKRCSVQAFKQLQYRVFAAGDSFNDVTMLDEADHGFFFCAPENVVAQYPDFPLTESYDQLLNALLIAAKAEKETEVRGVGS